MRCYYIKNPQEINDVTFVVLGAEEGQGFHEQTHAEEWSAELARAISRCQTNIIRLRVEGVRSIVVAYTGPYKFYGGPQKFIAHAVTEAEKLADRV